MNGFEAAQKMQNERFKDDEEDNDTTTTHEKASDLDTYNTKHKSIWWKTPTLSGTIFPPEQSKMIYHFKFLPTFSTTKNKPRLRWLLWGKRWKVLDPSSKNNGLTQWKEPHNQ